MFNKLLKSSFLLLLIVLLVSSTTSTNTTVAPGDTCLSITNTQINGTVYDDRNYNGTMDESPLNGVQGVVVEVYDIDNVLVGSATTNLDGNYSIAGLTTGEEYRVEFILPLSIECWSEGTHSGPDSGTKIQFVEPGKCASLGIADPSDYCPNNNPLMIISCFEKGNAYYGATGNTNKALVTLPYSSSGGTPTGVVGVSDIYQVGSVWGSAWQPNNKKVFSQTFLKRHTGLGPEDLGGIYVTDLTSGTATYETGFTLQGLSPANGGANIDFGTVNRVGVDNALADNNVDDSWDIDAFGKIGKVGYGDSEIGPDGNTLWLVNVQQRALISLDVSDPTVYPGTVNQYPFSAATGLPTCTNGVLRPWGLSFYEGKGYLGCVCTAENSGTAADLHAYVLSFDPKTPTAYTTEIDFALDYNREKAVIFPGYGLDQDGDWHPWADTWAATGFTNNPPSEIAHAQPILSDIEFAADGSMLLGFADRFGFQMGFRDYIPVSGDLTETSVDAAGDLIKVCNIGGSWVLEGAAGCANNDNTTNSALDNDGPNNNGEFFYGDGFDDTAQAPTFNHNETFIGSLTVLKGTNEVVASHYDPVDGANLSFDLGLLWHDIATGARLDEFRIIDSGPVASKGNNLGDIETICAPAPLEIGNLIWLDSIINGIQDPTERKLDGVIVQLYDSNGLLIGQTISSNGGQYFFNQNNIDTTGITVNMSGTVTPNTAFSGAAFDADYYIVFGDSQFAANEITLGAETFEVTPMPDTGSNEYIDSDIDANALTSGSLGAIPDGLPFIFFTTNSTSSGEHLFDVAFRSCIQPTAQTLAVAGTCTNDIANNDASMQITNVMDADKANIFAGSTYAGPAYDDASNFDVSDGMETITGLPHNTQYTVRVFNLSSTCYTDYTVYTPSVNCCGCNIDVEQLCWDQSMYTEPIPTPSFPYTDVMDNITDIDTDLSITLYQPSRDAIQDSYVSPGDRCGCDFAEVGTYMNCDEVFRNWKDNSLSTAPDTIVFSFASPVVLDSLMFGGFRAPTPNFAITEFTFYDGPDATGNKVVSTLSDPGSIASINTGDPTTAAINILQDKGMQQTVLHNGTYFYIGEEQTVRGWTVLNMGAATVQSIQWVQYASTVDDPANTLANYVSGGNVNSGYLSSFGFKECVCCKDPLCLPITITKK